jgi:hypothetical protein
MRSTSTTLLPVLISMRVDRFFLRVEEKNPASPWRASLESANLALAHVYDFLPRLDEESASSMERQGRCTGATRWDDLLFITAKPHSLGGGGGQHRGKRTGMWPWGLLLAEPPLESRAIPATEMSLWRRRGRRKPGKGIEGGRQGRAFIKKVRMHKWYDD